MLLTGDSHITVQNSEIFNNGQAAPSAQSGAGIQWAVGALANTHIKIGPNNRIHDNNIGIEIANPTSSAVINEDVAISGNRIYSNANDAILATAFVSTGGVLQGIRVEDNELFCNGWPANGAGFSTNCVAGFQQNGSSSSQGGVGVDLIQNGSHLIRESTIVGNRIHDNIFEGVATTSNIFSTVSTVGTSVTWVSGSTQFNPQWKSGQVITIAQVPYRIASVASATSLTLQTSAGTQTIGFAGPSLMDVTITGNISRNNGNALMSVGPGFYNQFSDDVTYSGNIAISNNFEGFENFYGNSISHSGDKAYSNDTGSAVNRNYGFADVGGIGNQYIGITADDPTASPTQTVGVNIGTFSTGALVMSISLYGLSAKLTDTGVSTQYFNGTLFSGLLGTTSNFQFGSTTVLSTDLSSTFINPYLTSGQIVLTATAGNATYTNTGYFNIKAGYQINGNLVLPPSLTGYLGSSGTKVILGTTAGASGVLACWKADGSLGYASGTVSGVSVTCN